MLDWIAWGAVCGVLIALVVLAVAAGLRRSRERTWGLDRDSFSLDEFMAGEPETPCPICGAWHSTRKLLLEHVRECRRGDPR